MPRFRSYGQLDDPFTEDGDPAFMGLDQFSEPSLLGAGFLQEAENIRIEQGQIISRGGLEKIHSTQSGKALVKFQDPISVTEEMLLVSNDKVIGLIGRLINDFYEESSEYWDESSLYFTGRTVDQELEVPYENYEEVIAIQSFDKVLLFSALSRPKEWDGRTSGIDWDTNLKWDSELNWLNDQEVTLPTVFDVSEILYKEAVFSNPVSKILFFIALYSLSKFELS